MTTDKPALSTRLNQFWARMLAPINSYPGSALIIIALGMALVRLSAGIWAGMSIYLLCAMAAMFLFGYKEARCKRTRCQSIGCQGIACETIGWRKARNIVTGIIAGIVDMNIMVGIMVAGGLACSGWYWHWGRQGWLRLVTRLIQIERHLAALRKGMENGSAASAKSAPPAKAKQARETRGRAAALLYRSPRWRMFPL